MKKALLLFLLLGCPAKHPSSGGLRGEAPHRDTWAKLTFEERHSVMTFTVLPNMARTWRDFEKTKNPEMTCRTCHGKDAEAVSYRMPNPALPRVDPAHPPVGPVAAFMKETVVPNMIELTGTTPEHFGCNQCHPR